jgi:hypothetical protein
LLATTVTLTSRALHKFHEPGCGDWDFAALKNFRVTESKQLQFRAELFDVLNRTNLRLPDSDISSPTFNHILAAESPRQVQFALKFMF